MTGWIKPEQWMIDAVAEALGIDRSRVEYLASHKTIRFRVFRGILYAMLKRDLGEYYEGTVVIFGRGWSRVIPGYPHIRRVVLPSVALPRHFVDKIVVEEKLNGYNVRVVLLDNNIYAITRGGFICPYTTNRITRMLGEKLKSMFRELDPEDYFVAGEVIGLENPYTRYYYPEAPRFGYFVFDLFYKGTPVPPSKRDEITESYSIPHVPVHGIINKNDIEEFKEIVRSLNNDGREGVVLKDPEYRVPPLKYTTTYTNIEDIRIGMKFFMEEGRSFLFSRIIREIFRAYEEDLGPNKIEQLATEIGLAILEPAIDTVRSVARGVSVYEEFELEFSNEDELNEFIEYMSEMGIDIIVLRKTKLNGMILAKLGKIKETAIQVKKILESGLAPID